MGDGAEIVALAVYVGSIVIGGVVAMWLVWVYAPPVGGEWWPYIRVAATLIGGVVGAKIAAILATLLAFVVVGLLALILAVID